MTLETIRDILDWSTELHQELAAIYRDSSDRTADERTRMLLNYLADQEQRLAVMISRYERDETPAKIETWAWDYIEKNPFLQELKKSMQIDPMDSDSILQATVEAHQKLIQLYKDLANDAATERLQSLFENMATMESNELMRMVLSGERWSDI